MNMRFASSSAACASRSLGGLAAQVTAACGSRSSRLAPGCRRAFTLVELMVVITIVVAIGAVMSPVLGTILRDSRLNGAVARITAGLQETRAILTDYPLTDRSNTIPQIPGALFTGTALVFRWEDTKGEYEVFQAVSAQGAMNPALVGKISSALGTHTPSFTNGTGFLATAGYRGYSRLVEVEPMTLGTGVRVAGLRAKADGSGLELVPSPTGSFAVCVDAAGTSVPPADRICVNLQISPAQGGSGPWNVWDTTLYDAAGATTGAYAASYQIPSNALASGTGEAFLTSLPIVVVYREDDLPLSGKSPSGADWRVPNPNNPGFQMINPALDPNELLAVTRGRLVMLTLSGGSPTDY